MKHGALDAKEAAALAKIEGLIGRPIPAVKNIQWDTVGVVIVGRHVHALGLYGCALYALPSDIAAFVRLETLNLAANELRTLPAEFGRLAHLKTLSCTKNKLQTLPNSIGDLRSLRTFYCNSNLLESLPGSIVNLSSLRQLNLDNNRLTRLPAAIGRLKELRDLNIGSNRMSTLSEPHLYQEGPLLKLNLDSKTPTTPFQMQAAAIGLSFNQISRLPDSIGDLRKLEVFSAAANGLRKMPGSISKWPRIREIDLSHNMLQNLPEHFGQGQPLRMVDLRQNRLRTLPAALLDCPTITHISLMGNPIPEASLRGRLGRRSKLPQALKFAAATGKESSSRASIRMQ